VYSYGWCSGGVRAMVVIERAYAFEMKVDEEKKNEEWVFSMGYEGEGNLWRGGSCLSV